MPTLKRLHQIPDRREDQHYKCPHTIIYNDMYEDYIYRNFTQLYFITVKYHNNATPTIQQYELLIEKLRGYGTVLDHCIERDQTNGTLHIHLLFNKEKYVRFMELFRGAGYTFPRVKQCVYDIHKVRTYIHKLQFGKVRCRI